MKMKKILFLSLLFLVMTWAISPDQLVKQGIALRDSGKYEEAFLKLEEALKAKPKHAEANFEMGLTLLKKYDCTNALKYITNAEKFGYNALKTHIAKGKALLMCGNTQETIIEYQLALEIKPNSPEIHTLLGDVYLQTSGSSGLAESEYRTALQFDSSFVPAIVGMANYYQSRRQTDNAIALYEKAKAKDPRYADTYYQLALVWADKKEYNKTITELKKYIQLLPRDPKGYAKAAEIYEKNKDYDNAISCMRTAIQYGDSTSNAYRVMSYLYNKTKRFAENKEILKRILDKAPSDVNIWMELARSYALVDSAQLAIDAYNRALNLDPNRISALSFTLGLAYYQIAKYDSAIIMFTKKIELDSLAAGAYINRALCHIQLKKYDKARRDLEKGIKIQPSHIQAHMWLGDIYLFQNLKAKARAEYKAVLKLNPGNKEAAKKLKDLDRVPKPPAENYDDYIDEEYMAEDTLK